jgi:proline utilization trans-activator
VGSTACIAFASKVRAQNNEPSQPLHRHYYNHVSLSRLSTASLTNMWFNLPDKGYARLLVQVVFRFIGADYYFFLKKSFLEQLEATYRDPVNADPVWLTKMFTVLALGELYSSAMSPMTNNGRTPGMQFFQQAMRVLQDLYEDPTVEYIEVLLLIVSSLSD